jgi:hypothetical protein
MSDFIDLTGEKKEITNYDKETITAPKNNVPDRELLKKQYVEASLLVEDIVLKNYLSKLTELELIPLDESFKNIGDIRLFRITEMVYQNDEYSTYKFASVFNSVQSLNCGVFIIADSDGKKTDFYMGVRNLDEKRTTKSLKDTLRNALCGQFPGVKTVDLLDTEAEEFLGNIQSKNIASVSCVANNKDEEFTDNKRFIQGLEKLALAMQGQRYTAIVLAKSTPPGQLTEMRHAYETIYTQLSPLATTQISYGTNGTDSITDTFSYGKSKGKNITTNITDTTGRSETTNESVTQDNTLSRVMGAVGAVGGAAAMVVGGAAAIASGGAAIPLSVPVIALGAAGAAAGVVAALTKKSITTGFSETENTSHSVSVSEGEQETTNEGYTYAKGKTSGTSDNMQLTIQDKTLINTLKRIDLQLERLDECESLGIWECAAYFLSDSAETTEMAAGTYKALMKGEKSGVETSAINFWGRKAKQLPMLREYITNFIHPVFEYRSASKVIPLNASSLVSGNELAIQMGLPRKSICGFPVIEHADFGKEVVKYDQRSDKADFVLGKVFSMGSETGTEARLDRDSLTMHTFITGSTGSGKSNTVYEILDQLRKLYNTSFLVVEPAKGEYKNVFGQFSNVSVYGTNPKKTNLLRINPFRFPSDIHVLEHLDRLVELFNVCWPMYAAMPAILKDGMEKAYKETGWDLGSSENPKGEVYPNFSDLLAQIEIVIEESEYSAEFKSNYSGALCTRVRSLTNGLNSLIFCSNDLSDADLFDKSVIADLSRVGSTETKSLIMGLLVMKLNEYRMTSGKANSPLSHITVLEEAHNLLKRTSTEQSSESSNLLGKSVELLANSIAEMRTYGEGFIIADQSPGLLDMSVIRNTNTKIILRLPDQGDRELVGLSASLDKEQIKELSKLEDGVAAIYQNDWVEPVLVKVSKCGIKETPFEYKGALEIFNEAGAMRQIVHLLIQGRVSERLDFDTAEIRKSLNSLRLTTRQKDFIERYIDEYDTDGNVSIWREEKFGMLAKYIGQSSGLTSKIEEIVAETTADEVTEEISLIIRQKIPGLSDNVVLALVHCLMKDFSIKQEEAEARERIYKQWVINSETERSVKL